MMSNIKPKKIVIATGIFPPEIGGPAFYAEMLRDAFVEEGNQVSISTYGFLKKFPTGLRHFFYAIKIIPAVLQSDFVIALDTFSVALPAVFVSSLFGKKIIVRVGGDFLWEEYVERTHEPILLSEFYEARTKFTLKEKYIYKFTKYALNNASTVVFSTMWQRDIFQKEYSLDESKISIIENVYQKNNQRNIIPNNRILISPSRFRFLKNKTGLEEAMKLLKERYPDITLDTKIYSKHELSKKILESYCLVVPSFSEVSPNIVIDSLSLGVPVVATMDCGIRDRVEDLVVWVDPKNPQSIADGVFKLMDEVDYSEYLSRISKFNFTHTPKEIAEEFINIYKNL